MRRDTLRIGAGLLIVGGMAACTQRAVMPPARDAAAVETSTAGATEGLALQSVAARPLPAAAQPSAPPVARDPLASLKLIRTGHLSLEVADFQDAAAQIDELARRHGGYVAASQSQDGERSRRHGTVTLRIPADRFDAVLGGIKAVGKVLTDKIDTQDVTKLYFDLETRLRSKRTTEARLREILRTRTARLTDVLEAERELARVTEEIEQMEGQRRFYDEQVAYATVVVSLEEPRSVVRPNLFDPVRDALRESLRLMALSAAGLVSAAAFLAPWLVLLVPAWFMRRAWRRRPTSGDKPGVPA
jgi:hypothetical protein